MAAQTAQGPQAAQAQEAPQAPLPPSAGFVESPSARETRQRLQELLREYPPSVGQVLRLDPSLMSQPAYLSAYPELGAFLGVRPEIGRNPAFFFGSAFEQDLGLDADARAVREWGRVFGGATVLAGFMAFLFVVAWIVRSILEHRRWLRASSVQVEAHTKLLDRFTANDDLLAYIETPAGRRFLEAAPLTLDAGPRAMAAPFGRILWSAQSGLVLGMAGLGLQFVSRRVVEAIGQGLYVMGVVAFSLGVGFILSSAVAYVLSRRLGLFESAGPSAMSHEPTLPSGPSA